MPAAGCFSVWFWLFWPVCAVAARLTTGLNPMWLPVGSEPRGGLRGSAAAAIVGAAGVGLRLLLRSAAGFGAGDAGGFVRFGWLAVLVSLEPFYINNFP